jgi:hypothetical protein
VSGIREAAANRASGAPDGRNGTVGACLVAAGATASVLDAATWMAVESSFPQGAIAYTTRRQV